MSAYSLARICLIIFLFLFKSKGKQETVLTAYIFHNIVTTFFCSTLEMSNLFHEVAKIDIQDSSIFYSQSIQHTAKHLHIYTVTFSNNYRTLWQIIVTNRCWKWQTVPLQIITDNNNNRKLLNYKQFLTNSFYMIKFHNTWLEWHDRQFKLVYYMYLCL